MSAPSSKSSVILGGIIGGEGGLIAGAGPPFIWYLFEGSGVSAGIVGGVIGIIVGAFVGIVWLAPRLDPSAERSLSGWVIVGAFLGGLVGEIVGLAAGAALLVIWFFTGAGGLAGLAGGFLGLVVGAGVGIDRLAQWAARTGYSDRNAWRIVGFILGGIGGGIVGVAVGVLFPFLVVVGGIFFGAWLGKILGGVLSRVLIGIGRGVHRLTVFVWVIVGPIYSGVRDATIKVGGFVFSILGEIVAPIRSLPVDTWDLAFAGYSGVRGVTTKVWDTGGGINRLTVFVWVIVGAIFGGILASSVILLTNFGGTDRPVYDYESLIDDLRGAGATVEETAGTSDVFSVEGRRIEVNGNRMIWIFEFPDELGADTEVGYVSPSGYSLLVPLGDGSYTGPHYEWVGSPHFYKKGRVIVLYVEPDFHGFFSGDAPVVLDVLQRALGPQFAGSSSFTTSVR